MKTKHLCVAFILSLLAFQACTTDDVSFTEDSGPDGEIYRLESAEKKRI